MRPSISMILEPGLERGVPWGCDLYTFVTSAAGHMMRTLQKPHKSRPAKRQVNHRRFLHNMIQRKFADIEAANQRLASAIYFKEEGKNLSSLPSQEPATGSLCRAAYLQDPDTCSVHTGADSISKAKSDVSVGSSATEIGENQQPDSGHLWKQHPKAQPITWNCRQNNQSKARQRKESKVPSLSSPADYPWGAQVFHTENDEECLRKPANNLSRDSQINQQGSGCIQSDQNLDVSPVFPPGLCPLSSDSCDSSIQMFTDISTCTQAQNNISESLWTDILDLLSVGSPDSGDCMDVEAYFESICACQADAGADDAGFAQKGPGSNRSEVEDLHCEDRREYGYSCDGVQGLTVNHIQNALRQHEDTPETQFDSLKASIGYDYDVSELQTYQHLQEENPRVEDDQNFTLFEGVAQSFTAPLHNPEHPRPIPTPPHEDEWLFTDILKDRNCSRHIEDCYLLSICEQ